MRWAFKPQELYRFEKTMKPIFRITILVAMIATICPTLLLSQEYKPLVYEDTTKQDSFGAGKHIVFLAGDHEYRSEETLPAMAKILAKHHGFKCTVLFNINKEGFIQPGNNNMPGLEALKSADLMVNFLRFQNFPDEQMQHIADYIDRGGAVVGLRTSTHAFNIPPGKTFSRYSFRYQGEEFRQGFGRQILGETWVSHYGKNHVMGTRLDVVEKQKSHPILSGVEKPFALSGGYWVEPKSDSTVLAMAQPLESLDPDSKPAKDKKPCPGAWVRSYSSKSGKAGRVFTSTYGASVDIQNEDYRRLLLNGCIWACGLESKITADMNIAFVGGYTPVDFGFHTHRLNVRPSDYADWDSNISPEGNPIGKKPKRNQRRKINYPAKNRDNYKVGKKWDLVWADEFEGDKLNDENWTRQIMPKPFNDEWQQYFDHQENSFVKDGCLVLKAIHKGGKHGDNQYTSARLHTGHKQSWKYGKIAARIQLPHGKGIWPAFWMLGENINEIGGDTPWPKCGEIDILEMYGSRDDGVVEANLHYDDNGHKMTGAKKFKLENGKFAQRFHVFEIEWSKDKIVWRVNGKKYCESDISGSEMNEFHNNFYILLNIAVGGKDAGRPDKSTPFPAQMYVDWVRVYQPAEQTADTSDD